MSASAVAEGHVVQVQCGDMGQFRLGPLLDEEYRVSVSGAEEVLARPGDRLTLKVGDRGELRAVLVGEPDPLLRSVAVTWIQTVEGGPFGYCSLGSSQSPVLELEGAPEGVYSVLVAAPDGRVAWARGLQLRAGVESDPVELRWEPGARLAARVAAPGSDDSMLLLRRSGDPIAVGFYEGGASLELVAPAGHAQLEFWVGRERRTSRPVDLRAGERLEVDLGAD